MVGVVLIFHNIENILNYSLLLQSLNEASKLHFCLVNNGSTDNTLKVLEVVKENCKTHIQVLDVKIHKSEMMAIKSAARLLNSTLNLNFIGYLSVEDAKDLERLNRLLNSNINFNQDLSTNFKVKPESHRVLIKNVFPLARYMDDFQDLKQINF